MESNQGVAKAWKEGRAAHSGNMSTNGREVYSYHLRIGYTEQDGSKTAEDHTRTGGCYHSTTTSGKHVKEAKRQADHIIRPDEDVWRGGYMPYV